ncbi:tRNA (N6-threonylcarbamoyladenosine(37)-N6)-methyltransferase TrmO [Shewanella maritima]|uniref:tRNA (N6-threonylcarbamoyladenosine(37)-N6)-methyltransferase TrmO n=1 Tax=Shewanella maritima TaxID=2520507 RepID=UPI003734C582
MISTDFQSNITAVAYCRTPYKQKFGIPRQPGLVDVKGWVELVGDFNHIDCVRGIEQYSHIWLVFCFHENLSQGWKTTVKPPRLGGNDKLGVFATRATFRPNGIGQSVVKLHRVVQKSAKVMLEISGMDLLDNTPVIDIKPYIPFSDSLPNAVGGMAQQAPELIKVNYSALSIQQINAYQTAHPEIDDFQKLITGVLAQDPRPAYKKAKADPKIYQVALYDQDILWQVTSHQVQVLELKPSSIEKFEMS